jgi:hypothetical protein
MTEAITDSAGLNGPVEVAPAPKKRAVGTRATKKAATDIPAVDNVELQEVKTAETENVITAPTAAPKGAPQSNTASNADGVIGSRAADKVFEKPAVVEKPVDNSDKVAIWSDKNIRWSGVGALIKGYNIVTKEAAEKWLDKNGIREATPEEVATHYGR